MHSTVRLLVAPVLIGLVVLGVGFAAVSSANAAQPRVLIVDNDAPTPNQGLSHWTAQWGFSPSSVTVMKGESVVFDHPAGNFRPHNVVSISRAGTSAEPVLESGAKFSSGTAMDTWLRPGGSWTLDTNTVDAGYYSYYCTLHPWMVGSIAVLPAP